MKFIKQLCIGYIALFIYALSLTIISNFNPYFLLSSTFTLLIVLWYMLIIVHLSFTIIFILLIPRGITKNHIECFNKFGFRIFICHLCDCYIICKERKDNE